MERIWISVHAQQEHKKQREQHQDRKIRLSFANRIFCNIEIRYLIGFEEESVGLFVYNKLVYNGSTSPKQKIKSWTNIKYFGYLYPSTCSKISKYTRLYLSLFGIEQYAERFCPFKEWYYLTHLWIIRELLKMLNIAEFEISNAAIYDIF